MDMKSIIVEITPAENKIKALLGALSYLSSGLPSYFTPSKSTKANTHKSLVLSLRAKLSMVSLVELSATTVSESTEFLAACLTKRSVRSALSSLYKAHQSKEGPDSFPEPEAILDTLIDTPDALVELLTSAYAKVHPAADPEPPQVTEGEAAFELYDRDGYAVLRTYVERACWLFGPMRHNNARMKYVASALKVHLEDSSLDPSHLRMLDVVTPAIIESLNLVEPGEKVSFIPGNPLFPSTVARILESEAIISTLIGEGLLKPTPLTIATFAQRVLSTHASLQEDIC